MLFRSRGCLEQGRPGVRGLTRRSMVEPLLWVVREARVWQHALKSPILSVMPHVQRKTRFWFRTIIVWL